MIPTFTTPPDYSRQHVHPDGTALSIDLFRGSYYVAAKGSSIGGFGDAHGTFAFETGVRIGTYSKRLEWVTWASKLPLKDLPTLDIEDGYLKRTQAVK